MTFFILGSNPQLSIAEIAAVLGKDLDYSRASSDVLLLDTSIVPTDMQERLAGVVKIGSIIGSVPLPKPSAGIPEEKIAGLICESILSEKREKDKITFGLSVYGIDNPSGKKQIEKRVLGLGLAIKKQLKTSDAPVRFASSKETALSSVFVLTNHLLSDGGEFVLIPTHKEILIGKTQTAQDFQAWSRRDYGRPGRDAKSGMLPPKLARLMVNLTGGNPETDTLLDPFCGSGTVLMEALLMGYKRVIGTDISAKATEDTKTNLTWLSEFYRQNFPPATIATVPAKALNYKNTINTIATEPYLGPPLSGKESPEQLIKNIRELEGIYKESFENLTRALTKTGTMVIVIPVFRINEKEWRLSMVNLCVESGLSIQNPLPPSLPTFFQKRSTGGGIMYERPDQFVIREIFVLRKV